MQPSPGDDRQRSVGAGGSWVAVLLAARVIVAIIGVVKIGGSDRVADDDVLRFQMIADSGGWLDHDVALEYAPLEIVLIKSIAGNEAAQTGARLVVLSFACDVATWMVIRRRWGVRQGLRYLALGSPLLVFIYLRFDPVPILLAVGGVAASRSRHQVGGGVLVGLGVLAKVWPAALLPGMALSGRRRTVVSAIAAVGLGAMLWVIRAGLSAPRDVSTFRGARGWGVESTVGSMLWVFTSSPTRVEQGAPRVGSMEPIAAPFLGLLYIGVAFAIWRRAAVRGRPDAGSPALAAIAALLVCSPLYSLQYASWLVPWAALADEEDGWAPLALCGAVTGLTGLLFFLYASAEATPGIAAKAVLVFRNAATLAIPLWWLTTGAAKRGRSDAAVGGDPVLSQ